MGKNYFFLKRFYKFLFSQDVKTKTDESYSVWTNEEICKINFKNTIKRLVRYNKGELIYDPFLYIDIKWFVENKENKFKILLQSYTPENKVTLNMPKTKFAFRPVTYLQPVDTIVYQAIVDQIINYKQDKFSKFVYSNIINKIDNAEVFSEPVKHWKKMRDALRSKYHHGFNHYFFSDISGYFENIKLTDPAINK